MRDRPRSRVWAVSLAFLLAVLLILSAILLVLNFAAVGSSGELLSDEAAGSAFGSVTESILFFSLMGSLGAVGALVAIKRERNAIGWLLLITAVMSCASVGAGEYARYATTSVGGMPGSAWMAWVSSWLWLPPMASLLIFLPLLFPTGTPPSRRWRPAIWIPAAVLGSLTLATAVDPKAEMLGRNPAAVPALEPLVDVIWAAGFPLLVLSLLVAFASLVVRFRRAGGTSANSSSTSHTLLPCWRPASRWMGSSMS